MSILNVITSLTTTKKVCASTHLNTCYLGVIKRGVVLSNGKI